MIVENVHQDCDSGPGMRTLLRDSGLGYVDAQLQQFTRGFAVAPQSGFYRLIF